MFRLHPHQHGETWIREAQLNLSNFLTLLTQPVLALRAEPQPPVNERQRGKWKPRSRPLSFWHAWPRPMKLPTSRFPANPIGNHGQQRVGRPASQGSGSGQLPPSKLYGRLQAGAQKISSQAITMRSGSPAATVAAIAEEKRIIVARLFAFLEDSGVKYKYFSFIPSHG